MEFGTMTENPIGQANEKLVSIDSKLTEMAHGHRDHRHKTPEGEFSDVDWVAAERQALCDWKDRIEDTVTIEGEFVGIEQKGDKRN